MTFAIVDSSSGAASAAAMNPAMVSGVAGRISMPPTISGSSWSRYWNRVTTPKLPPPPRIAQNRSGWWSASTWRSCAVGGHDLGREQVVDGQAVLAHEVADAAAERDPADADRAGVAEADGQAVLAERRGELRRGQAGLGPRRPAVDVDVEPFSSDRSSTMPPSVDAVAGAAVAAAADGELEAGLAREATTAATSSASATLTMAAGSAVDRRRDHGARLVVVVVAGGDDPALERGAQLWDREGGGRSARSRVGGAHVQAEKAR